MQANITALIHRRLAAFAGIEVVLTRFALHQFILAGYPKTFGGRLMGLEFLGHTPLEVYLIDEVEYLPPKEGTSNGA